MSPEGSSQSRYFYTESHPCKLSGCPKPMVPQVYSLKQNVIMSPVSLIILIEWWDHFRRYKISLSVIRLSQFQIFDLAFLYFSLLMICSQFLSVFPFTLLVNTNACLQYAGHWGTCDKWSHPTTPHPYIPFCEGFEPRIGLNRANTCILFSLLENLKEKSPELC
jgi:hypothetical protein